MQKIRYAFYFLAITSVIADIVIFYLFYQFHISPGYFKYYGLIGAIAATIVYADSVSRVIYWYFKRLSSNILYYQKHPFSEIEGDKYTGLKLFLCVLSWFGYIYLIAYVY